MTIPRMKYDFPAEATPTFQLKENLEKLDAQFADFDALVLTSKDPFLSEYVPVANNPRYGATGFTGSVGDCIYWTKKFRARHPQQKAVSLFVDGRYHLQADNETPADLVEVVKLEVEPNIEGSVRERLATQTGMKVGVDFERTAIASLEKIRESMAKSKNNLQPIKGEDILTALALPGWKIDRPIFSLKEEFTGRTIQKLLTQLRDDLQKAAGNPNGLLATCATDDAAFLLNARGHHLPHSGSVLAYTFFTQKELLVFLPSSSEKCKVEIDPAQLGEFKLTVIRNNGDELKERLCTHNVSDIFYNGATMNGLLPSLLTEVFPQAQAHADFKWVMKTRLQKTPAEMNSIRRSFIRSSKAIAKTLRHGKAESQKRKFSEIDLAEYLYQSYAEAGAVGLSFSTISGAGPHSAIVHYSKPDRASTFDAGMLALLDSGAYYAEGFCTDCTRGFFVGGTGAQAQVKPEAWQTEIYTATLKSAIQVFIEGSDAKLSGQEVDAKIRGLVKAAGYDYAHGTGHGVGILVHEDGIRLSTLSTYPQTAYACVSVEPGIYLKDKGGVRVENIALLIPDGPSRFQYENVVFVGYDWDLIDVSKLTNAEKTYLKDYEGKCRALGTELMACPL